MSNMVNNKREKEKQIITLRLPIILLKFLDKLCVKGERNSFLVQVLEDHVNSLDTEKTQAEAERSSREILYSKLKKEYSDSVIASNKLLTTLESRSNLDELNQLAYQLGCPREADCFGRILLGQASAKTIQKMYAYKLETANSLFSEDWQLYLQLLDERQKQKRLMVALQDARNALQNTRVKGSKVSESEDPLVVLDHP
jgi:hypothetical protein